MNDQWARPYHFQGLPRLGDSEDMPELLKGDIMFANIKTVQIRINFC